MTDLKKGSDRKINTDLTFALMLTLTFVHYVISKVTPERSFKTYVLHSGLSAELLLVMGYVLLPPLAAQDISQTADTVALRLQGWCSSAFAPPEAP